MSTNTQPIDAREIKAGLEVYAMPGGIVELFVLGVRDGKWTNNFSGYFEFDKLDHAALAVKRFTETAAGVYVGINQPKPELLARRANRMERSDKRTAANEILKRTHFVVDCDSKKASGVSATDEERALTHKRANGIVEYTKSLRWPTPTRIDSGNGMHLVWTIDLPNDEASKELIHKSLKALGGKFTDDAVDIDAGVSDASRLIRIPGSMARKGDDCPSIGRVHRKCTIISRPEVHEILARDLLEDLAGECPSDEKKVKAAARPVAATTLGYSLDKYTTEERIERLRAYTKNQSPCRDGTGGEGERQFLGLCCVAVRFGLDESNYDIFEELNARHCEPLFDSKQLRHKVESAIAKVGAGFGELLLNRAPRSEGKSHTKATLPCKPTPVFTPPSEDYPDIGDIKGQTEEANARRLVHRHRGRMLWCEHWKSWRAFDGQRWAPNDTLIVENWARETVIGLWSEMGAVASTLDAQAIKGLVSFIRKSNAAYGINSMLKLSRSLPGISVAPCEFNSDPWLFNVQNGTIDLRTGSIRSYDAADKITQISPVTYDPSALCPEWRSFIDVIFCGNRDLIRYVQARAGYSMTGLVNEQDLSVCYGKGANGKGTLLNTLLAVFGDYGMTATKDLLMAKDREGNSGHADLYGKRLVVTSEPNEGSRLDESGVKLLTGGDGIRTRKLYENLWEFQPTHKLWLAANHKPTVRGEDHGIWRRLKLVPFKHTFTDETRDKSFPSKLREEWSGILNWLLEGLADWRANGLVCPDIVQKESNEYRKEQDNLADWMAECCIEAQGETLKNSLKAKAGCLYASYTNWTGPGAMSNTAFGLKMASRFEKKVSNGIWYLGIGLKALPK